ncbi:MAG: hypothetical protein JRE23_14950 [Deltaproteobacteria bacterium]|nr:hypothetical protein [Deltaproteobacteria bacterium]
MKSPSNASFILSALFLAISFYCDVEVYPTTLSGMFVTAIAMTPLWLSVDCLSHVVREIDNI